MSRFNSMSLFLIFFLRIVQGSLTDEKNALLALFGISASDFGTGFVFDEFVKARIEFQIYFGNFEAPKLLDCSTYQIPQPTSLVGAMPAPQNVKTTKTETAMTGKTILETLVGQKGKKNRRKREVNPPDDHKSQDPPWPACGSYLFILYLFKQIFRKLGKRFPGQR